MSANPKKKKDSDPSVNKILGYLEDLIDSKDFQDSIYILRKKYNVPPEGLYCPEEILADFKESGLALSDSISYGYKGGKTQLHKLWQELNAFFDKKVEISRVLSFSVYSALLFYFFHNIFPIDMTNAGQLLGKDGLCEITDAKEEYEVYKETPLYYDNYLRRELSRYPICLRITPEASQRNLIQRIKQSWPEIEELQNKYKKNKALASTRRRDDEIKLRDSYIWENREKPLKEIRSLVYEKFKSSKDRIRSVDEGLIGKIIVLETKRRT